MRRVGQIVGAVLLLAAGLAAQQARPPQPPPRHRHRVLALVGGFRALAAAAAGATVGDVALSQHCESVVPACREMNPLLPNNRVALDGLEAGVTGGAILAAYALERRHLGVWRVPLLAAIGAHGVAMVQALRVLRQAAPP